LLLKDSLSTPVCDPRKNFEPKFEKIPSAQIIPQGIHKIPKEFRYSFRTFKVILFASEVQMAKIKARSRPGALSELLKQKGMTQMDAKEKTGVDRKTLSKIERGEEVKLETLQQVANRLQVPEEHFSHVPAPAVADDSDVSGLKPGTIMLRKLDAARLEELLGEAKRFEWRLNAKVRDDEARKFLENFETAVEKFHADLRRPPWEEIPAPSLRVQLDRLKIADDIVAGMELFAEHRFALLGADHLIWERSYEEHSYEDVEFTKWDYCSFNTVLLSVEPFGTQSRRAHISIGKPPPFLSPDFSNIVYVNGKRLPCAEEL
jgi:transcriptional regulator with XRE-family HTH domain